MRVAAVEAAVRYSSFTLGPISVELVPGLTVLVGPSGAGKSTLLALLAGLRPPHSGSIRISERDIAAMSERDRSRLRKQTVAVALQNPLFLDELDLISNLRRAAELRGEREVDADRWLAVLGLADRACNLPAALSGGELSRAATVRALATACPVVLLDEPTAMLDEENAIRVRDAIIGVAKGTAPSGTKPSPPRAVLVATHDVALIAAADQAWRITEGQIE
jgi:ABC-type lipoprotein export system ATPase subunit